MSKSPETKLENRVSKRSFWRSKIEEWRQSGLSQPVFASNRSLSTQRLGIGKQGKGKKSSKTNLLKSKPASLLMLSVPKCPQ